MVLFANDSGQLQPVHKELFHCHMVIIIILLSTWQVFDLKRIFLQARWIVHQGSNPTAGNVLNFTEHGLEVFILSAKSVCCFLNLETRDVLDMPSTCFRVHHRVNNSKKSKFDLQSIFFKATVANQYLMLPFCFSGSSEPQNSWSGSGLCRARVYLGIICTWHFNAVKWSFYKVFVWNCGGVWWWLDWLILWPSCEIGFDVQMLGH